MPDVVSREPNIIIQYAAVVASKAGRNGKEWNGGAQGTIRFGIDEDNLAAVGFGDLDEPEPEVNLEDERYVAYNVLDVRLGIVEAFIKPITILVLRVNEG